MSDNAVTERSYRYDVTGGSAQHLLCLNTHLEDAVGVGINRHYRRLLKHNALALNVNKDGCRAEVNADVSAELELLNEGFCTLKKALFWTLFLCAPRRGLANINRFFSLFCLFHEQVLPSFYSSSSLLYIIFFSKSIYFRKILKHR